jgi:hypothetical protein
MDLSLGLSLCDILCRKSSLRWQKESGLGSARGNPPAQEIAAMSNHYKQVNNSWIVTHLCVLTDFRLAFVRDEKSKPTLQKYGHVVGDSQATCSQHFGRKDRKPRN